MNLENLNNELKTLPAFRQKQTYKAIFNELIDDWENATSLPKELRQELNEKCPLEIKAQIFYSNDKFTAKALIEFEDGKKVETVLMRHRDGRNTVCVSTQIGCPLACEFCATGQMGFKRNLSTLEIAEQVLMFARILKSQDQKVTNIVFMGMGEPFLNSANVFAAIKIFKDKNYFNIGSRRISISTCGIVDGIRELAKKEPQVNLAISLHAPNDELRSSLMPLNKKYPLKKVLDAVDKYIFDTNRKVMFEYTLIQEINDSGKQARQLADLLKGRICVVNLVPYNSTGKFTASTPAAIENFKNILIERGLETSVRHRFGEDINAACGQLKTSTDVQI